MKRSPRSTRPLRRVALCAALACTALPLLASHRYEQVNLTSDVPNVAPVTDPHLAGAWGIAASATGPWWVNTTFGGTSVVYDGDGKPFPAAAPLVVTLPPPANVTAVSAPTGIVSYAGSGFAVGPNLPARFLFVTRTGAISGWNPQANRTRAIVIVQAPADFGKFGGHILVGMFGSGDIAAFDPRDGNFRGILRGPRDHPFTLGKGLWGLAFGNGATAGAANHLYFGADIVVDGKFHGLFGAIAPTSKDDRDDDDDHDEDLGDNDNDNDNDDGDGGPGRG